MTRHSRSNSSRLAVLVLLACFSGAAVAAQAGEVSDADKEKVRQQVEESGLTDAAVAKLSGDQIHDILRHQNMPPDPPAIATVGAVGAFATTVLIVFVIFFAVYRVHRQRHETLRLMVEKGVPVPPELITPARRPGEDLRRGLILVTFGIGLGIFLLAVADSKGMWTLGLVPVLVGVGYLISWKLTGKAESAPAPARRSVES